MKLVSPQRQQHELFPVCAFDGWGRHRRQKSKCVRCLRNNLISSGAEDFVELVLNDWLCSDIDMNVLCVSEGSYFGFTIQYSSKLIFYLPDKYVWTRLLEILTLVTYLFLQHDYQTYTLHGKWRTVSVNNVKCLTVAISSTWTYCVLIALQAIWKCYASWERNVLPWKL